MTLPPVDRRMGSSPQERGSMSGETCPDVLRLRDGSFLVIGDRLEINPKLTGMLAGYGASVGEDEAVVHIKADVLRAAALDIAADELD